MLKELIQKLYSNGGRSFGDNSINTAKYQKVAPVDDLDEIFISATEFLKKSSGKTNWLVEDLIPQGENVLIAGETKVGKTLLALDLSRAITSGKPFLEKKVKKGTVLCIELDDPEDLVCDRLETFQIRDDNFFITNRNPNKVLANLNRFISIKKPLLIIVDTFVKFLPSSKENAENDAAIVDGIINQFNNLVPESREYRPTIIFIHHLNKGGGVRGSTALEAAIPTVIKLKKEGNYRKLEFQTKRKPINPITARFIGDRYVLKGSKKEAEIDQLEEKIASLLRKQGQATEQQIAKELGLGKKRLGLILESSDKFKSVSKNEEGKSGRPKKYWVLALTFK